ncbi:MAG: response regulator transcription factor [Chloroflexi bacterium]|nr:response regulator transcription factor [Chloroflexota bacterium]
MVLASKSSLIDYKQLGQNLISVLLVDEYEFARKGIRSSLAGAKLFKVVGDTASAREAIDLARRLRPDVLVLALSSDEAAAVSIIRNTKAFAPQTKVLVLVNPEQDCRSLFEAGAGGFLLKSASGAKDLKKALLDVAQGGFVLIPAIAGKLLDRWPQRLPSSPDHSQGLTPRESEVLAHVGLGLSNPQIATALGISTRTVEVHVNKLLLKLGARSRTQAALAAVRSGILA